MTTTTVRDNRLDGLKFFLVCMVVVGHCIQPFRYDYAAAGWAYGIIYSFHMPLFIILSGYFFKMDDRRRELLKCLRLLETFVLITLVYWVAGGMSYTWPLVRIGGPSWYLLSLLCWRAFSSFALRRTGLKRLFVSSVVMAVVAYVTINKGEGLFSIMRTIQFYPYFLLGYAIRQGVLPNRSNSEWPVFVLSGLSVIAIMLLSGYALYTQEFQGIGLAHWCRQFGMSLLVGGGYYLFIKIASLAISYVVWRVLKMPDALAPYGRSSLLIYSIHTMTLPLIYNHCTALWQTSVLGVLTILATMLLSRARWSVFLTNPMSTILEIRKHKIN